jgi:hypothetical protein
MIDSFLKLLIVAISLAVFTYCATLAIQGNLDYEVIIKDYNDLKIYFLNQIQFIIQKILK